MCIRSPACAYAGSSVSLGADLLSIYDDARRNLDVDVDSAVAATVYVYVDDGDLVEMLPAERHGENSALSCDAVGSTRSQERQTTSVFHQDVDERASKRPLSVSSTSSSMSSTSSLPRHEHKKLATAVQSPPPLPGVEDASPDGGDGEAGAGCLSTVAESVPAVCERCRPAADDGRHSPPPTCSYDGEGDVVSPNASALGGNDDHDDEVDAAGIGHAACSSTTLSRSQYVDRVVTEIIDTERAYVDDLDQIIHVRITLFYSTCDDVTVKILF